MLFCISRFWRWISTISLEQSSRMLLISLLCVSIRRLNEPRCIWLLWDIFQYFQSEDSIKEVVDLNVTCSDHIASLVEVQWEMGDRKGIASLKGITLSSHMLDIVRMSPINWGEWESQFCCRIRHVVMSYTSPVLRRGIYIFFFAKLEMIAPLIENGRQVYLVTGTVVCNWYSNL